MNLNKVFSRYVDEDLDLIQALDIVKKNAIGGKIWIIGGTVYKTIIKKLYGTDIKKDYDYDFVVEKLSDKLIIPKDWNLQYTSLGSPRIKKENLQIDIIPLRNLGLKNYKPTISQYLLSTPLDIQSIAYDVKAQKVIGELGMKAILAKEVRGNDVKGNLDYFKKKGILFEEYAKNTSDKIRFKLIV